MLAHVQRVRILYKTILRLHRSLPKEAKIIGDLYVKDEFRRHKKANPKETEIFMKEWSEYAVVLGSQVQPTRFQNKLPIGKDLSDNQLASFRAEQVVQLYELLKVTPKGKDSEQNV